MAAVSLHIPISLENLSSENYILLTAFYMECFIPATFPSSSYSIAIISKCGFHSTQVLVLQFFLIHSFGTARYVE